MPCAHLCARMRERASCIFPLRAPVWRVRRCGKLCCAHLRIGVAGGSRVELWRIQGEELELSARKKENSEKVRFGSRCPPCRHNNYR